MSRLQRQAQNSGIAPVAASRGKKPRFSAASVRSQRKRLGVSATDYGKLVGVTAHTIYQWEHSASKPRRVQLAALAALRGLGKREAQRRLQAAAAKSSGVRRKTGPGRRN